MWITTNCGKFLRLEIPDCLTCLLRNLFAGQEATVQPDIEQQSGSKLGKDYIRCVYYHLANLTYMQNARLENVEAAIKISRKKKKKRFQGEISVTAYMQMTPPLRQKAKSS